MKKLYLWVFLLCCSTWLSAQAWSENFDASTDIPSGWTVINNGDDNTWTITTSAPLSEPNSAGILYSSAAHDDYLITPQFEVTDASKTLTFAAKNEGSYYQEKFDVLISTTGNNASDFTDVIASNLVPNHVEYDLYTYDLSSYTGQNVYIAFHITTTNMYYLYIDNVSVNDGVIAYDCPELEGNFGDSCNDGNDSTSNDIITEDCECVGTLPPVGSVCENPITITSVPYTITDNTENYGDDYSSSDVPSRTDDTIGDISSYYMGGDDVVYSYIPTEDGTLNVNVTNHGTYTGFFIIGGCPFTTLIAGDKDGSASAVLEVTDVPVLAGETYYIVISTFASPQSTDYTLNFEFLSATADSDGDGVPDVSDNCPNTPNADQADADEDGIGDVCEADTDGDGIIDDNDNCPDTANPDQADANNNGIGDVCDATIDINVTCGNDLNDTYCYDSSEEFTWSISSSTGGPITITFNAGNLEASSYSGTSYDDLIIYDGVNTSGEVLFDSTDAATNNPDYLSEIDLTGLSFTAQSGTLYVTFESDSSTSCAAGSSDMVEWDYTLSCVAEETYDCPELEANIGDACDDNNPDTEDDVITEDCGCAGTPIETFDCPELEANIGDACDDGDATTENDVVTADCGCEGTLIVVYDCPELEANIGDACDDGNDQTENDVITADCGCEGTPIVDDCPAPTGVTVDVISASDITFYDVEGDDGDTYDVVSNANLGFDPLSINPQWMGITMPFEVPFNLAENWTYEFYARRVCGENVSDWAGPFQFTVVPGIVTISPNPVEYRTRVFGMEVHSVKVYDMFGRLVMNTKVIDNTLHMQGLSAGNYTVHLFDKAGNVSVKQIIKR